MFLNFLSTYSLDWTTGCLLVFVFALSCWALRIRLPGMPTGPVPLPIFGNLVALAKKPMDDVLMEWREKYGDIYTIFMGGRRVVAVCGYENIREFYTNTSDDFLDRPFLYVANKVTKGSKGVVVSNGTRWRESRKFALMMMRDFGLGGQSLRDRVVEEGKALCDLLAENDSRVVDMKPMLTNSVSNVICSIVFGRRFDLNDVEFVKAMKALESIFQGGGVRSLANFIPWMRFLPFVASFDQERRELESFFRAKIDEHRATFDAAHPRDFIDLYLQIEHGVLEFDKSTFDEDHMFVIIRDLFFAGTETTATTLLWGVLLLALNEDVQTRCCEEIRRVLGVDGAPEMAHRQEMPFVEATILEMQRIGDIATTGVLRCAAKDTTFKGYHIPKGTIMLSLLHSVHYDALAWPEPGKFSPDRWLNAHGNVVHHDNFMPFSLGRRNCLGESLAKVELFLFFVMVFQRFSFSIPVDCPRPTLDAIVGITRMPRPFKVLVRKAD